MRLKLSPAPQVQKSEHANGKRPPTFLTWTTCDSSVANIDHAESCQFMLFVGEPKKRLGKNIRAGQTQADVCFILVTVVLRNHPTTHPAREKKKTSRKSDQYHARAEAAQAKFWKLVFFAIRHNKGVKRCLSDTAAHTTVGAWCQSIANAGSNMKSNNPFLSGGGKKVNPPDWPQLVLRNMFLQIGALPWSGPQGTSLPRVFAVCPAPAGCVWARGSPAKLGTGSLPEKGQSKGCHGCMVSWADPGNKGGGLTQARPTGICTFARALGRPARCACQGEGSNLRAERASVYCPTRRLSSTQLEGSSPQGVCWRLLPQLLCKRAR